MHSGRTKIHNFGSVRKTSGFEALLSGAMKRIIQAVNAWLSKHSNFQFLTDKKHF